MKKQIAKELGDSGLFDDCMGLVGEINQTHPNIPSHELEPLPYPTADQSEAALGEMGLQVVRERTDGWELWDNSEGGDNFLCSIRCDQLGQRTLANNAAIAWLANQPDWKPKLKEALERLWEFEIRTERSQMNGLIKNSADALDFTRWVLAGCPGADIKSEHAKRANEALGEFLLANYDPDNRLKDMGDLAEKSDVFMNEMYYFVRHWHDVKIGTN